MSITARDVLSCIAVMAVNVAVFYLGVIAGERLAYTAQLKKACAVPCSEKYVKLHTKDSDPSKWFCTCTNTPEE